MKRLRHTRTMGGRDGIPIFMFSLSLSSRHKCSVDDERTLSLSEVIGRVWRLCCFSMENKTCKNNEIQ